MKLIMFYCPLAVSGIAFCTLIVVAILWQRAVETLIGLQPETDRNPDLHFNFAMLTAIRTAEGLDNALARRMRKLLTIQIAAFIGFLSFGLFALLMGGIVM